MSCTHFRVNLYSIVPWVSRNFVAQNRSNIWSLFTNYVVVGLSPIAVTSTSDIAPVSSKEFLDTQATIECGFTLKCMIWHDKNIQYLSCFVLILRGIHKNIDICQTVYNIPSILEFSPYSEIIHWCTTFKLTKC